MFILAYSLPRVMLTVTDNADRLVSGYPLSYSDIACALFIIVFIITTLRSGYSVEDVEKMEAELAAENASEAADADENGAL
jgi:hypothetical protein